MLIIESIWYKNFLSTGNDPNEIDFLKSNNTILVGGNGEGKCVSINTKVRIRDTIIGGIEEITIGDLYEKIQEKQNST